MNKHERDSFSDTKIFFHLRYVRLVGYQGERVDASLGEIRLDQNIHFAMNVLGTALRYYFAIFRREIVELVHLVVAHFQLLEFLGARYHSKYIGLRHYRLRQIVEDFNGVVF